MHFISDVVAKFLYLGFALPKLSYMPGWKIGILMCKKEFENCVKNIAHLKS